jgi:hypothetical protein
VRLRGQLPDIADVFEDTTVKAKATAEFTRGQRQLKKDSRRRVLTDEYTVVDDPVPAFYYIVASGAV